MKHKGAGPDQCEVDIPEPLVTLATLAYLSVEMVFQLCCFVGTGLNWTVKLFAKRVEKEN